MNFATTCPQTCGRGARINLACGISRSRRSFIAAKTMSSFISTLPDANTGKSILSIPLRFAARITLSARSLPADNSTFFASSLPFFAQSPQTRLNDAMIERSVYV